jgi:hypothetical protein
MANDEEAPPMPRWVKVAGAGVGALILGVIVMTFAGSGGSHGPGRHLPPAGAANGMSPVQTETDAHTPGSGARHASPAGAHQ